MIPTSGRRFSEKIMLGWGPRREAGMVLFRLMLVGLALAPTVTGAAAASVGAEGRCLSRAEQRAEIAEHKLMRLSTAMKEVKRRIGGDVVGARLCQQGNELVYVLTVLTRNGKVARERVDAVTGAMLGVH
jgi:uncharacterized membrane protein YkoI